MGRLLRREERQHRVCCPRLGRDMHHDEPLPAAMTRLGPLSMVFIVFLLIALVNAVRSARKKCDASVLTQPAEYVVVGFAGVLDGSRLCGQMVAHAANRILPVLLLPPVRLVPRYSVCRCVCVCVWRRCCDAAFPFVCEPTRSCQSCTSSSGAHCGVNSL